MPDSIRIHYIIASLEHHDHFVEKDSATKSSEFLEISTAKSSHNFDFVNNNYIDKKQLKTILASIRGRISNQEKLCQTKRHPPDPPDHDRVPFEPLDISAIDFIDRLDDESPPPLPPRLSHKPPPLPPASRHNNNTTAPFNHLSSPSVTKPSFLPPPNPSAIFECLPNGSSSATAILKDESPGSFLVRQRSNTNAQYALDIKMLNGNMRHILIKVTQSNQFVVVGYRPHSEQFTSIDELLQFYSKQKIDEIPLDLERRIFPQLLINDKVYIKPKCLAKKISR